MIELRHFRYFVAVAEELSFSRAAETLGLTQPSLSRQIVSLEQMVGGPLFERTRRKVSLTALGLMFLDEAQVALGQVERSLIAVERAAQGHAGSLTMAYSSASIFNPLIPELVHRFRQTWPDVEVTLNEMATLEQLTAAHHGKIDIGFMHLDSGQEQKGTAASSPDLAFHTLAEERLVLAVARGHPLARRRSVALKDLTEERFFVLPAQLSSRRGGPFTRLAILRGAAVEVAQEVRNVPAMIHLAATGMGVALVPESLSAINLSRIRFVPVSDIEAKRTLLLVSRKLAPSRPAINFTRLAGSYALGAPEVI